METKHSAANCCKHDGVSDNHDPIAWTGSLSGVGEDDRPNRNFWCWKFLPNQFQMFPLTFLYTVKGSIAGFESGYTQ